MNIGNLVKSQFLDVIEHIDENGKLLVYKWERYGDEIKQGASLMVREGQVAAFVHKGQIADIFAPGSYKLDTHNLPILSSLAAVPRMFNSPIKSDLYFINTTQFIGNKWGTKNPIMMRDKDFGVIRIRAFGTYAFKVSDAKRFITEIFGARKVNMTYEILEYLNSFVSEAIAEVMANSDIPVLDLAMNYRSLSGILKEKVNVKAQELGLDIFETAIENVSLPDEVEKMIDEQSGLGLAARDMNAYVQYQTVRAMRDASKQAGGLAGLGAGIAFGKKIVDTVDNPNSDEPTRNGKSHFESLREYKMLLDEGVITTDEFAAIKDKILNELGGKENEM